MSVREKIIESAISKIIPSYSSYLMMVAQLEAADSFIEGRGGNNASFIDDYNKAKRDGLENSKPRIQEEIDVIFNNLVGNSAQADATPSTDSHELGTRYRHR